MSGMSRVDYFDDPAAPAANSIVPSVTVAVRNQKGEMLLIHRTDNDLWALPGGGVDLGESVPQAGVRETEEETGFQVKITGLVGIYSDPRHVLVYDDGEVRQQFSICMHGRIVGGQQRESSESSEVRWVSVGRLDKLDIHPSMRLRINRALSDAITPYLG